MTVAMKFLSIRSAGGKMGKWILVSLLLTYGHERAKYHFVNLVQYLSIGNHIHLV